MEQIVRLYTVRDDIMLAAANAMHGQYVIDKADFEGYNIVMFPITFQAAMLAKIQAASTALTDDVVIDQMAAETVEVGAKLAECISHYLKMKPTIELAFPNNPSIWNQFGFNDFKQYRGSHTKMIKFMKMLFEVSTLHSAALIAAGYTAPKIAAIETLATELEAEEKEQEMAIKNRPVMTFDRINLYNEVWKDMRIINRGSKAVYQGNYGKLNQYELPGRSNAWEVPVKGDVPPGATVNVLEMEFTAGTKLKIKNTGTVKLAFGLAADAVTPVTNLGVAAMSEVLVTADNLGDVSLHFLNSTNNAVTGTGSYEVSLET